MITRDVEADQRGTATNIVERNVDTPEDEGDVAQTIASARCGACGHKKGMSTHNTGDEPHVKAEWVQQIE